MSYLRIVGVFIASICLAEINGQIPSNSLSSRSKIFDKLYQPKLKIIGEDTIYIRPRWFFPKHAKVQYAGSIGFFSLGFGYRLWDIYEPTLMYGYLSENFGGSNVSVHTVSLKSSFYLTSEPWLKHFWPRAGLLINWGNTNNTFRKLPPYYPEKYYFQNKIHAAPFGGGEWYLPIKDKHFTGMGIYFEFSALDAYLLEAVRTNYVNILEIWSLGVGVSFYIH